MIDLVFVVGFLLVLHTPYGYGIVELGRAQPICTARSLASQRNCFHFTGISEVVTKNSCHNKLPFISLGLKYGYSNSDFLNEKNYRSQSSEPEAARAIHLKSGLFKRPSALNDHFKAKNIANYEFVRGKWRLMPEVCLINTALAIITMFGIIAANLERIGLLPMAKFSSISARCCLTGSLCTLAGLIFHYMWRESFHLNPSAVLMLLLPPVFMKAGLSIQNPVFGSKSEQLTAHATGAVMLGVTIILGMSLWALGHGGLISGGGYLMQCLLVASLVCTSDDVASQMLFPDAQERMSIKSIVHQQSVIGLLVTTVLCSLLQATTATASSPAAASTAVTALWCTSLRGLGGAVTGTVVSRIAHHLTESTSPVCAIQSIVLIVFSCQAFFVAEMFNFSGIIACIIYGYMVNKQLEKNSSKALNPSALNVMTFTPWFCESVSLIFMASWLLRDTMDWRSQALVVTLLLGLGYRALGITLLAWFTNKHLGLQLTSKHQLILGCGALRSSAILLLLIVMQQSFMQQVGVVFTGAVILASIYMQDSSIQRADEPQQQMTPAQVHADRDNNQEKAANYNKDSKTGTEPAVPSQDTNTCNGKGHEEVPCKSSLHQKSTSLKHEAAVEEHKVKKNVSFADEKFIEEMLKETIAGSTDACARGDGQRVNFCLETESDSDDGPININVNVECNKPAPISPAPAPPEPTAAEATLPWKRNTGRPPISCSFTHSLPDDDHPQMSEAPAWVESEMYHHLPAPLPSPTDPHCDSCSKQICNHSDSALHSGCDCTDFLDKVDSVLPPPWKCNDSNCVDEGVSSATKSEPSNFAIVTGTAHDASSHPYNSSVPPSQWKLGCNLSDTAPVRSPLACSEHEITSSLRPQYSSHSLRLSEAESKHSEHIHMHHMIELPSHHSADEELDLPSDDEQDTRDRVHAWLLDTRSHHTDIRHDYDSSSQSTP